MSNRLHTLLPVMGWKRVRRINPQHAAKLTNGNTDKFMNKDYWVLGSATFKNAGDIPINARAVYYHDGAWWVVEKVRSW